MEIDFIQGLLTAIGQKYELDYSDKGLHFWEGGVTLIEGDQVRIQLRKKLKSGRYWIYDRDEILCHELVHVARREMDQEVFEEVLAYRTSKGAFRRFWGPIFSNGIESLSFMVLTGLSFVGVWLPIEWGDLLFGLPLLYLIALGLRTVNRQSMLDRALQVIRRITPFNDLDSLIAIAIMLKDGELIALAKGKSDKLPNRDGVLRVVQWLKRTTLK